MVPPMASTNWRLSARPSPVPATGPRCAPRRSKGWNKRACCAALRPGPLSATPSTTVAPLAWLEVCTCMRTQPPARLYLMALDKRLHTTCSRRLGSARTSGTEPCTIVGFSVISAACAEPSNMARASASTCSKSTGSMFSGRRPVCALLRSSRSFNNA